MKAKTSILDGVKYNPELKKEFAPKDHAIIERAIFNHLFGEGLKTRTGNGSKIVYIYSREQMENLLGLPYTSTSSFAALWVTNVELDSMKYPGYSYQGFAITTDGQPVAYLQDYDESPLIINIKNQKY